MRNLTFIAVCSLLASLAAGQCTASQRGVPSTDPRLLHPITIASRGMSLQAALRRLSHESLVALSVDGAHRGFENILFAHNLPLRNMMIAMAWANRMTWQRMGTGYLLTQTPGQKAVETAAVWHAHTRRLFYREAQINSFTTAVQRFVAKPQPTNPAWQMLTEMDAPTLAALESLGDNTMAVFPAGGTAHTFRNYLFGLTRYRSLPVEVRHELAKYIVWEHRSISSDLHFPLPAFLSAPSLPDNNFGFFTYNGFLNFATTTGGNGHVWWGPDALAARKPIAGYDINNDDSDPQVVRLLPKARFDQVEQVPERLLRPSLHFTTSQYLPDLMQQFHLTTGAAVVCTRFVNSLATRYQGLLTYHNKFTLPDAIQEVDRAFGYHSAWFGGMLVSRTTDPGRDIYNEPPAGLMGRMAAFAIGKGPLSLADIQRLGRLDYRQRTNLWWYAVAAKDFHTTGYIIGPTWRVHFMDLLGSLTPAQLASAEGATGIPAKQLTAAQRMQLILATDMGTLPLHPKPVPAGLQPGFYVHVTGTPASVKTIQFIAAYPYLGKLRATRWTFQAKMGQNDLSVASK